MNSSSLISMTGTIQNGSNLTINIGGIDFIAKNLSLYLPFMILYSINSVIGSLGKI